MFVKMGNFMICKLELKEKKREAGREERKR